MFEKSGNVSVKLGSLSWMRSSSQVGNNLSDWLQLALKWKDEGFKQGKLDVTFWNCKSISNQNTMFFTKDKSWVHVVYNLN